MKIFEAMQNLVDKHVKAYKEDFEKDKELIAKNPVPFVWLVRPSGTFLIYTHLKDMDDFSHAVKFYESVRDAYANPDGSLQKGHHLFLGNPKTATIKKIKSYQQVLFTVASVTYIS